MELSVGLCAVDDGSDDFAGCKAHGCGLLVKLRLSLRPFLCYHIVMVYCQDCGWKVLSYQFHGLPFAGQRFPVDEMLRSCVQSGGRVLLCHPGCNGSGLAMMEHWQEEIYALIQDEMTDQGLSPFSF